MPTQTDIYAAKYIAEKWSEPIYRAVKNSTPNLRLMSESDVRYIISVCAGLNIMHSSLCTSPLGSSEWAQSVVESSIIIAYKSHYETSKIYDKGESYWINTIVKARSGVFGEIPGTNMEVETIKEIAIIPISRPIKPPKRIAEKTEIVEQYIQRTAQTYLMHDGNTGYIKIGKSINPKKRLRNLMCANPAITLRFICELDIEAKLHAEYIEKRIDREWFDLSQEDINYICRNYNFYEYKDE